MSRMNLEECKFNWKQTASIVADISKAIESLHFAAIIASADKMEPQEQKGIMRLIERLSDAETVISGLSYLCTPQSEWTGGESFKIRAPHIVTDRV